MSEGFHFATFQPASRAPRCRAKFGSREHRMGLGNEYTAHRALRQAPGALRSADVLEQFADFLGDPARFQMNQAGVRAHGPHYCQHGLGTRRVHKENSIISSDTHFR